MSTFGIGLRALAAITPSSSLSRRAGRQPSWREWGSRCFFAPPEGSRLHLSLFRCVDLSEEHAGAPGCILLAAKTAIVMELSAGNTTADGLGG